MYFYVQDELLWGAAWLFRATNDVTYYNFIKSVGDDGGTDVFSWDNKFAGAHVLLARVNWVINSQNYDLVNQNFMRYWRAIFIQFQNFQNFDKKFPICRELY